MLWQIVYLASALILFYLEQEGWKPLDSAETYTNDLSQEHLVAVKQVIPGRGYKVHVESSQRGLIPSYSLSSFNRSLSPKEVNALLSPWQFPKELNTILAQSVRQKIAWSFLAEGQSSNTAFVVPTGNYLALMLNRRENDFRADRIGIREGSYAEEVAGVALLLLTLSIQLNRREERLLLLLTLVVFLQVSDLRLITPVLLTMMVQQKHKWVAPLTCAAYLAYFYAALRFPAGSFQYSASWLSSLLLALLNCKAISKALQLTAEIHKVYIAMGCFVLAEVGGLFPQLAGLQVVSLVAVTVTTWLVVDSRPISLNLAQYVQVEGGQF